MQGLEISCAGCYQISAPGAGRSHPFERILIARGCVRHQLHRRVQRRIVKGAALNPFEPRCYSGHERARTKFRSCVSAPHISRKGARAAGSADGRRQSRSGCTRDFDRRRGSNISTHKGAPPTRGVRKRCCCEFRSCSGGASGCLAGTGYQPVLHVHASIYREYVTGDVSCLFAGEEPYGRRYVLRRTQAA